MSTAIDPVKIRKLTQELKANGREEEALAIDTLLDIATSAGRYYTSEEIAQKLKIPPEIVVAFVRKGIYQGLVIGDQAFIPKTEFADFDGFENSLNELDEITFRYTPDEINNMVKEARREWLKEKFINSSSASLQSL